VRPLCRRGNGLKPSHEYFLSISLAIYVFDLLTKWVVRLKLPVGAELKLLPFFSLTHVNNTGIAFGLFQEMNHLFLIIGVVVTCVVVWMGVRTYSQDRFSGSILAVILGGAAGNLTDRIFYGHVTDFLDFYIGHYHWPAFNVADSAICVSASLLLWHSLRASR
jgi:signal peptidase II